MASKPNIGQCATEDIGPPKEVGCEIPRPLEKGTSNVPMKTLGLKGVDCEISHGLERGTKYSL